MRQIFKLASFVLVVFTLTFVKVSQAQEFSAGIELGMPVSKSDNNGLGIGGSFRYEGPWGTQTSLVLDGGYLSFSGKTVGTISYPTVTMIPIQAGVKYYFDNPSFGLYVSGQLGIHFVSVASESQQDFGYAPGIGYHLEKIDVGVRFQAILGANNESYNFIGLRIAYILTEKNTYRRRRK